MYNVTCFMTVWLGTVSEFSTYFLFFSLCFYRRNFAKSLIFPDWLRSSNDSKQICRYPSCKVFLARWLLHITFLFYGDSNFVYTWCFNRTVLESTKLFTGFRHLLKFLLVMKEIIKDSYETAFQLLSRWFIFFPFFVCLFVFLYLAPIMVWKVGLSTLFMFPFLYLGFNCTVSFQKLILKTSSTSLCWLSQHSDALSSFIHGTMIVFRIITSII